jgi:hypothetical protein
LDYLKNKVVLSSILLGLFTIGYLIINKDSPTPEQTGVEEKVKEIKPVSEKDTIKVVALEGWGTSILNESFETEVTKRVGQYCKDCPLFFRKGKDEPISIHKYRKEIKELGVGDYLMVSTTAGKIDMPEINKTNNEFDTENMFSTETERREKEKREALKQESEEKRKAEEERKAREKDSLEKQKNLDTFNNVVEDGIKRKDSMKSVDKNKPRKKKKKKKNNSKSDLIDKEKDSTSSKKE